MGGTGSGNFPDGAFRAGSRPKPRAVCMAPAAACWPRLIRRSDEGPPGPSWQDRCQPGPRHRALERRSGRARPAVHGAPSRLIQRTAVVRTRMPGGVGGGSRKASPYPDLKGTGPAGRAGAAGPQKVEDRVPHLAQRRRSSPPATLRRRQHRLDQRERRVRQIACVASARPLILTAGGIGPHGHGRPGLIAVDPGRSSGGSPPATGRDLTRLPRLSGLEVRPLVAL